MMNAGRTYFSFDNDLTFLLKEWRIDSTGVLIGAVVAVFVLAFISHALQKLLEVCASLSIPEPLRRKSEQFFSRGKRRTFSLQEFGASRTETNQQRRVCSIQNHRSQVKDKKLSSASNYITSLLYLVNTGLIYILMLVVMTFNVWILVAVSLGSGLGYFLLFTDKKEKKWHGDKEGESTDTTAQFNSGYWSHE